ncbi:hypothetical protein ACRCD7_11280 [Aliarcobacter sp. ERUVET-7]|uniref:hypothetical protein n=1 Tax=Aliarcobacter TaxID=2321111 RepID=UPI002B252180|nr:hypothetical protein [Aliarcobacter butzleri]
MKFLLKYKTWILTFLFVTPLLLSLYVQYDENVKKYNYWNYEVLEKLNIATKEEINSLNNEDAVAKFKDDKKEIIKKFLPTSEQYKDFACYKKFNTNTDESIDIIINSLSILQLVKINDECFSNKSKQILFVSYLFIYIAISFTIIVLFTDKIRRLIPYKNHIAIIGLNKYSREIINQIRQEDLNLKIYDNNNANKYIRELENNGEIIINGELEYTIVNNNCEIINAKEIYIINDSDVESLNNLALLLDKFNDKNINRKIKNKTKIYLQLTNRENKAFFNANGIYKLISNNYEIYIFSINEIIVQNMFKDKSLVSNIKKEDNKYAENLKVLIVGFNDLSEEILYTILKLGHFDIDSIVEITVIDDNHELLCSKFNKLIEKGIRPYEKNNKYLWKLNFLPYKSFYNLINNDYNRIILCDKKLNNNLDNLNFIYNNFCAKLKEQNTIVHVFNEHNAINNVINNDKNFNKNFLIFGDLESTITLDNIRKNKLYLVAEYTNDFKETDENKKWKNLDSFTIESNITEKLHMNIKLDIFDLHIVKDSKNKLKIKENFNAELLLENYYKANKENIKEEYLNEAIRLPYSIEILGKLYDYYLEKKFPDYKDTKSKIKTLEEKSKKNKELVIKELEDLKIILKDYQIKNRKSLEKDNFYKYVSKKLVFDISKSNSDNMEVMMVISLIDFYLKIKHKPNFEDIIHNLAQIEHTRWNALHILNGWKRRKEKGKCMINKEHFDLCDWETLNNEDKAVIKYDYKNIYQIPFVVHCLGDKIINYTKEKK